MLTRGAVPPGTPAIDGCRRLLTLLGAQPPVTDASPLLT